MADNNDVLINVDIQATEALQQLTELRQKAADLRAEQKALDTSTAEGKRKYQELGEQIKAVNSQASERSKVIQNEIKQANANKGSLEQLGQKFSALRKQYRALSEEQRNSEGGQKLLAELSETNEKLKEAEAAYGSFGRNVGNYEGAISKLFPHFQKLQDTLSKLGINVTNVTNNVDNSVRNSTTVVNKGLSGLGTSLKSAGKAVIKFGLQLMATPLGWIAAAVALVVGVLKKLVDQFKKNDDAGTAVQKLMASFKPILQAVTKVFDLLATAIGKVAEALANLIAWFSDSAKAAQELVTAQDNLEEAERQYTENSARRSRDIAKLRNEAADKEKYTAEERTKMLKEAMNLEMQNLEEEKKIKAEQLRLLEEKAKQESDTSDETKNAIAAARAAMYEAEEKYYTGTKRLQKELASAQAEMAKEEEEKAKAAAEESKKAAEAYKKRQQDASNAAIKALETEQKFADEEAKQEEIYLANDYAAREAWAAKEYARKDKAERDKLAIQLKYNQISIKQYNTQINLLDAQAKTFYAQQTANLKTYYEEAMAVAKEMLGETEQQELSAMEEKFQKQQDILAEQNDKLAEEYETLRQKQMMSITAGDMWMDASKMMTEEEMARLREVEDQLTANAQMQVALEKKAEEEKEKIRKKYIDAKAAEIESENSLEVLKLKNTNATEQAIYEAELAGLEARMALYDVESEAYQKLLAEKNKLTDEYNKKQEENTQGAYQQAMNTAGRVVADMQKAMEVVSTIASTIAEQENAQFDNFKTQQESKKEILKERLEQGLIDQESYESGVQNIDAETERKQKELALKQAKRQKAMAIMNATLNAAAAIIASLAAAPVAIGVIPNPTGIASLALATATGAAQVAAAAATPLPKAAKGGVAGGGLLVGPSHSQGGIPIEAEGGEAIINKRSTARYRGLLSAINAEGGGARFAAGGIVGAPISSAIVQDGGYATRNAQGGGIMTAQDLANAMSNVQIYTAITDINRGQANYAQIQDNKNY